MKFFSLIRLTFTLCFSVALLVGCSIGYDRENFSFPEFMNDNGEDIAEYLQDNWDIDSAFIMHMGFFKARDWKSIYPEEMQTIFVGDNRYSESEYLEEKGFDVNAPLFIVYFSKLKKIQGNSYDDAGVNPGSLATEYSETGIDAAHENYESANYNYEDRLYYMTFATIVDGQFRLLMCCDSENFNDEVAFADYYNLIGKNESFYPFTIGGTVKEWKHKKEGRDVYEMARIDFRDFLKKQKVAVFSPLKKRKNKDSEFELKYNGFKSGSIKSLDYFFMIYNRQFIIAAQEKRNSKYKSNMTNQISKALDLISTYWSIYESRFGVTEATVIRGKLISDDLSANELKMLLIEAKKLEKIVLLADRLSKKIEIMVEEVSPRETYKLDALNDLLQSLKRGLSIEDSQNCKEESLDEYADRLSDLEMNFEEKFKLRIKYHK